MKPLTTAGTAFAAFGLACFAQAADPAADKAPPVTAPATTAGAAKPDAKALADAAAEAEANRMKVVFADRTRAVSAYFPKSQARIKVSAVTRFDPDMAKPREYFLFEMTGAAIVDPLVLDVEDDAAREALIVILERFALESTKSNELKESMAKRKLAAGDELSREETKLLDLQSAEAPDSAAIAKSKARIEELKEVIDLSEDLGKLKKISGPIGRAKIHLDRPAYEFIASMEPAKALYTLNAGYSFQVASKDVKFYVDLMKAVPELKERLLAYEARQARLKAEVGQLFKAK